MQRGREIERWVMNYLAPFNKPEGFQPIPLEILVIAYNKEFPAANANHAMTERTMRMQLENIRAVQLDADNVTGLNTQNKGMSR